LNRLRKMASGPVEIRGWVPVNELRSLYRRARGLIVAAREDFGIVTVEAQACGCPVIAYCAGGSSEIIADGTNGILYAEQHADDIVQAVRKFETMTWPAEQVRRHVEIFSGDAFQTKIRKFIARTGIQPQTRIRELQPA